MASLTNITTSDAPVDHEADSVDRADRVLLQAIAEHRDRGSMETFYNRYQSRLMPFLQRLTHDTGLVEEVYNDVMIKVWDKAYQFKGQSKVSSWVFSIGYRDCLRLLRRNKFRSQKLEHYAEEVAVFAEPASDQTDERVSARAIRAALSRLPSKQRITIEMFYFSGHTLEEIAEITACPANTVKTRLHHARRKLHDYLRSAS